ncbi:stromal membrane-associated protein 2 isoform X2 [Boleophthalmus pectinirostris]|uniref:stromal membrane-associated protein 2 isoform X2 n=1 Tax=Boleophthalmus pectinirostris TaxID=150288 RepID=UPI00242D2B39|nr:stromal membrane-associated protein 2 isoform X2 [Boleophthalmus pectinirostris]XP_055013038.1 stromal membrane-associated protein 2 isoform X2 [Boleophthalmus pectinirostris]
MLHSAQGPRWASWNLGVFVCIRCAGIHRNLGVHISKVKSVNLDQWTEEQVQCVQEMGNAKAKRLYEAFLPECFQRPETDQSAEIFIRDKYEKKKYMDKVIDIQMLRKEKSCDNIPKEPVVFEKMKLKKDTSPKTDSQAVTDLLGLDTPSPSLSNGQMPVSDSFESPALNHTGLDLFNSLPSSSSAKTTPVTSSLPHSRVTASVPENLSLFLDPAPKKEEVKKLSKDSILSLYASTPSVHANSMATHGLYMNQMGYTAQTFGSYHSLVQHAAMPGGMMTSQMPLMGQQQSSMLAAQPNMGLVQNSLIGPQQHGLVGAQGVLPQSNSAPAAYMSGMTPSMVPQQQCGMMGAQPQSAVLGQQQMYGQQAQQLQWNIAQITQHMAGLNAYHSNNMMSYNSQHMEGSAAPSSAHMTAHVWK